MVPLSRLTSIIMPHHGTASSLRPRTPKSIKNKDSTLITNTPDIRSWTAIKILKYGLEKKLYKRRGWLVELLQKEGLIDGTKQSKKERCWNDYKAQTLYIDAMKEATEDDTFDPRCNAHVKSKKDGKFKTDRREAFVPKNPLTVLYLCYAYDVPYATFKRWKNEAFVTTPFVPDNKGKSVIKDMKWATHIFNPKRMYMVTHLCKDVPGAGHRQRSVCCSS